MEQYKFVIKIVKLLIRLTKKQDIFQIYKNLLTYSEMK